MHTITMRLFIASLIFLVFCIANEGFAQSITFTPGISLGHVSTPEFCFFNSDCSRALTVSKSEAILWDMAKATPVYKAYFPAFIRGYNPSDSRWSIKAVPSPDLSLLMLKLKVEGETDQGFLIDMKRGKLSVDDGLFNEMIYCFTPENYYVSMRGLRTAGKTPNLYLQTYLPAEGSKTAVSIQGIKNFAPVGFSYDGKLVFGEDRDNNRFVIFDPSTGKIEKTNLKYDGKIKHYYYYTDGIYTSHWIPRAPSGKEWEESYYHVDTRKIVKFGDRNGLRGPYNFSDDGQYGVYFQEQDGKGFIRFLDMKSGQEKKSVPHPEGRSFIQLSRIPGSLTSAFYILANNGETIWIYDLAKAEVIKKINVMADAATIAAVKDDLYLAFGAKEIEDAAKADFDIKNFLVNFPDITHFSVNLSTAHRLKGYDITNLPFTKQHYTNSLGKGITVRDVLGLGKLATCGEGSVIFGVVRAVLNGKEDRSMFFLEKLDAKGNSLQFEEVGLLSKEVNGGLFLATLDLGVYVANGKAAVVTEQRYQKENKVYKTTKRTLMIDQASCVISEKK